LIAEIILMPDSPDASESARVCAQSVARTLSGVGIKVREQIGLCAGRGDLQRGIAGALRRSNLVMILGGLSPESGGVARQVVAQGLSLSTELNRDLLDSIRDYCLKTGTPQEDTDEALAVIPRGSLFFPGRAGKTPGLIISSSRQHIIMLPAVEEEAAQLLKEDVLPWLANRPTAEPATVTRTVRTWGISEEMVRKTIAGVMNSSNPSVTLQKEGAEILVRVSGQGAGAGEAAAACTPALQRIVDLLGDCAYGLDVDSLQDAVADKLLKKRLSVAIAESGSSGMLARVLNEAAGGSQVLRQSVLVDDDYEKKGILDIPGKLLKKRGGVCEEVAVAMADSARGLADADIGVAVTVGRGGDKRAPCGLVYIAVADSSSVYVKKLVVGTGDPAENNYVVDAALSRALNMIRLFVDYLPGRYMGAIPLADALAGRTVTDLPDEDTGGNAGPRESKGFARRFFGNFHIKRADRPGVKVKKLIFILAVLVFLGSAGYIGYWYLQSWQFRMQSVDLRDMYTYGNIDPGDLPEDFPRNYQTKFAALYARNEDIMGYVSYPGTEMAYPVVQSEDNEYYLRRDYDKNQTQHGIPFLDWRVDAKTPSDNMVVYGHNMQDGQLFGELMSLNTYTNSGAVDFYKEHPVFDFSTVYSDGQYAIFSVFITNAYPEQGPVFDYHNFIEAKTDDDFAAYVKEIKVRSLIDTGVDVEPGDKLVTLSTCTYEFTDARFVVVGRKLRRNETPEDFDTSAAVRNPSPLMPDIWYDAFGGSKPDIAGGANVVTSPAAASRLQVTTPQALLADLTRDETTSLETAPPGLSPEEDGEPDEYSQRGEASQLTGEPVSISALSSAESSPEPSPPPEPSLPERPPLLPESSEPEPPKPESSAAEEDDLWGIDFEEESSENIEDADENEKAENEESAGDYDRKSRDAGELMVTAGGKTVTGDALDIVSRIVQNEIGSGFHTEAIKAQAVAAYTFISFYNQSGSAPSVILAPSAGSKVTSAVESVLGEAVYYRGNIALTTYYATSAGQTASSRDVWGTAYSYLVSVDSPVDENVKTFKATKTFSYDQMRDIIDDTLGISPDGEPEDWFEILGHLDGGYVGNVRVCGETETSGGRRITGRYLRESVFGLRSSCFEIEFDGDDFIFTTYGYGHGVGMSQNGANGYANEGLSYDEILTHYYPGTEVY
jgi:SrtB family sortase